MRIRKSFVAAAVVGASTAIAVPAWAWITLSSSSGTGTYTADSVGAPTVQLVTTYNGTATLYWSAPSTPSGPSFTYTVSRGSGQGAISAACSSVGSATSCTDTGLTVGNTYNYTVTAHVGTNWVSNTPGTGSVTVAGGISKFIVNGTTSPITAGGTVNPTVTAEDSANRVLTGYQGTVHFISTDAKAVLPGDYTFTSGTATGADDGAHTFGVTLKTAGSQTVSVKDSVVTTATGTSPSVTVNPAAAQTLTVTGLSNSPAGTAQTVAVTAQDPYGNTATSYTGTIAFTSSDPTATAGTGLPTNYSFVSGDNGTRTFTNGVTLKKAGSQTVTATDNATSSITGSQTVTISPLAAKTLSVTGLSNGTAGVAQTVIVTAQDQYGNTATSYRGTVAFTSTDAQATAGSGLPSNYPFVAGDNGTHTFTSGVTLKTAGSQTVTAKDTTTATITGAQTVTITAAGPASMILANCVVGGTPQSCNGTYKLGVTNGTMTANVQALDAYGNAATISTALSLSVASSSTSTYSVTAGSSLTIDGTASPANQSTGTFQVTHNDSSNDQTTITVHVTSGATGVPDLTFTVKK